MLSSDWSSVVFSSDLRLDHVAVAAGEVVGTVCVDVEQVAGAVPAVGRERLVALAPVVALHQSRTAQPELAHLTCGEVGAGVGVDDPRLEPGHGTAARAAPDRKSTRLNSSH